MSKVAKIISYPEIDTLTEIFKDKRTVLVGGCFDLIHYGHLQFLKKAKKYGNFLIVILESDKFIQKNKRIKPVHSQEERAEILADLNFIDLVVRIPYFSGNKKYFDLVKKIRPTVIGITEGDRQLKNKKAQAESVGAEIRIVTPLLEKYSTRKIINRIE